MLPKSKAPEELLKHYKPITGGYERVHEGHSLVILALWDDGEFNGWEARFDGTRREWKFYSFEAANHALMKDFEINP